MASLLVCVEKAMYLYMYFFAWMIGTYTAELNLLLYRGEDHVLIIRAVVSSFLFIYLFCSLRL